MSYECFYEFLLTLGDCHEIHTVPVCQASNVAYLKVVTVWELCSGLRGSSASLKLRKSLYGHTQSVTCLASSGSYGIVVSGSQDCSCIVWDLSNLSFIRQLASHPGPVAAIAINDITGDIATTAGTHVFMWSINGRLLATVNTAISPKIDTKQLILSVCFSTVNEWDPQSVVVTGTNDGVVRVRFRFILF